MVLTRPLLATVTQTMGNIHLHQRMINQAELQFVCCLPTMTS